MAAAAAAVGTKTASFNDASLASLIYPEKNGGYGAHASRVALDSVAQRHATALAQQSPQISALVFAVEELKWKAGVSSLASTQEKAKEMAEFVATKFAPNAPGQGANQQLESLKAANALLQKQLDDERKRAAQLDEELKQARASLAQYAAKKQPAQPQPLQPEGQQPAVDANPKSVEALKRAATSFAALAAPLLRFAKETAEPATAARYLFDETFDSHPNEDEANLAAAVTDFPAYGLDENAPEKLVEKDTAALEALFNHATQWSGVVSKWGLSVRVVEGDTNKRTRFKKYDAEYDGKNAYVLFDRLASTYKSCLDRVVAYGSAINDYAAKDKEDDPKQRLAVYALRYAIFDAVTSEIAFIAAISEAVESNKTVVSVNRATAYDLLPEYRANQRKTAKDNVYESVLEEYDAVYADEEDDGEGEEGGISSSAISSSGASNDHYYTIAASKLGYQAESYV